MKKSNKFVNWLLKVPGGIYGIISVLLGAIFIFFSYLNFPGYSMMDSNISFLGRGPGFAPILFSLALISIGMFGIPFFIYLRRIFQQKIDNEKLSKRAIKISLMCCISLILIAFFPAINLIMALIHILLALIFFVGTLISLIYYSIILTNNDNFSKIHKYFGYIVAFIINFYLFVGWSIIEWIVFFAIGLWVLEISFYTLFKRLKIN